MLRIFGHFIPVPAVLLGAAEVLLVAAALYFVAPIVPWVTPCTLGLHMAQAQFSLGLSLIAGISMTAVGLYNYDVFLDSRVMIIKILMAVTLVAPASAVAALLFDKFVIEAPGTGWSLLFLKATFVWMTCVLITRLGFLHRVGFGHFPPPRGRGRHRRSRRAHRRVG